MDYGTSTGHLFTDESGRKFPLPCDYDDTHEGHCHATLGPIRRRRIDLLGCLVYLVIIISGIYLIGQGVRAIL